MTDQTGAVRDRRADGPHSPLVRRLTAGLEPPTVRLTMERCLGGELSTAVAIVSLLDQTRSAEKVRGVVDEVTRRADEDSRVEDRLVRDRVDDLTQLLVDRELEVDRIVDLLHAGTAMATEHPPASVEDGIARCEQLFDWSVQQSEEASVAPYSLGSPELLDRSTREIVSLFDGWGLLGPDRAVLQIGCGIGRMEAALAGRVGEAHGVDVSERMVAAARRRTASLPNVTITKTSGQDLSIYGDRRFDMVYAVDTFPYLLQAGRPLVERHFAEVHRVLRPGGELIILNFSYRGDADRDRTDIRRLAHEYGFTVVVDGEQPFELWDGRVWRLRK
ncbi:MAG TPA: class I SAM-dependent methyltransferase [Gemmatimonadaceae bacterium]|nr:class I SAM-dependent methyltransferase [Gemmatimonadaceae bacterium]